MALAALKGEKTITEIAQQFEVHPTQVNEWRRQLLKRAGDVFGGGAPAAPAVDLKAHAKIGQRAARRPRVPRSTGATRWR